jgi:hypothetical protein
MNYAGELKYAAGRRAWVHMGVQFQKTEIFKKEDIMVQIGLNWLRWNPVAGPC